MSSRTNPNLYVIIHAGLGNQMFQYAAGKALAKRLNTSLVLDRSAYANQSPKTARRDYMLDAFRIDAPTLEGKTYSPLFAALKEYKLARQFMRRQGAAGFGVPIYEEPHRHFDPRLTLLALPVIIRGYWQSERYFAHIGDEIRSDFQLKAPLGDDSRRAADKIASAQTPVSIHLRRGDKVANPKVRDMFSVLSDDYYRRAISLIEERVPNPLFFIFSDEPEAAERFFDFCPNRVVVDGRRGHPAEDLALMSQCDHHIIAVSSFSWWGAWLNPSPDKVVVAPRPWYNPAFAPESDTVDHIPEGWIRLAANG